MQRACIVRALALRPDYLILDEITAMLDAETARDVLARVRKVTDQRGIGVLLISHDQSALDEFADLRWTMTATPDGPVLRPTEEQTEIKEFDHASHTR